MNKLILLKVAIFCFCCFFYNSIFAKVIPDLYGINIPVASQGDDEREQALKDAFRQVIVKVSGFSEVLGKAPIKKELKNADNYVRSYSYSSIKDSSAFMLHVEFSPSLLQPLLKQAGFTPWTSARPTMLVWMVVRDAKKPPILIDQNSTHVVAKIFRQAAVARGIPLIFPMGDIDEITSTQTDSIIAENSEALLKPSMRYAPDVFVLIDVFIHTANSVEIHWLFVNGGDRLSGSEQNTSFAAGIDASVNSLADTLAHSARFSTTKTNYITLQVTDLTGASDYQAIMRYLKHLNGVVSVQLLDVTTNEANFQIAAKISEAELKKEIGFSSLLESVTAEPPAVTENISIPLVYRYHKT